MTIHKLVKVEVTETTTYEFPNYPDSKCPAHGDPLCVACARNPSYCTEMQNAGQGGCGFYSTSGMHWDTCPNRIR